MIVESEGQWVCGAFLEVESMLTASFRGVRPEETAQQTGDPRSPDPKPPLTTSQVLAGPADTIIRQMMEKEQAVSVGPWDF